MATEAILRSISLPAAADLSAKQFHFVKVDSSGNAAATAAVTDNPVGVLQNNPDTAGYECTVAIDGVSKVEAGGSITAGDLITIAAAGTAVTATEGTNNIYGIALSDAASGEVASVLLRWSHHSAANA